MVAGVIGAGEKRRPALGVDFVVVAELVFAQVHRRAVERIGVHLDGRLILGTARQLRELLEADLRLGGEIVGPVVEQVDHRVLGEAVGGVPVAAQADRRIAVAVDLRIRLFRALVGEAGAVVVADVPVQLDQIAVVRQVGGAAGNVTRIQAVAEGDVADALDVARRNRVAGGRAITEARVVRHIGRGAHAGGLLLFGGHEEEQLVLDDRTAQGHALGGVDAVALVVVVRVVAVQIAGVAHKVAGVAICVIDRAVEIIGARLGHRVDAGAHAVGGGVEIRGGDVVFGDGVGRDRRALVRQAVGVEAKRVALRHTVHADVVVTRVLAVGGDGAGALVGHRDARIKARDVRDRAVGLRRRLQLFLGKIGRQALVVRREGLHQRAGGHGHTGKVLNVLGLLGAHGEVDRAFLAQLQVHLILLALGQAGFGCGHIERAAHAHALRRIASIGASGGDLRGAGRLMHDLHGGAGHRLAGVVEHASTDG